MLTPDHEAKLNQSSRTLAIFGKFAIPASGPGDGEPVIRLGGESGTPLSASTFFGKVRPELRTGSKDAFLRVGNQVFQVKELQTPVNADPQNSVGLPLTADSPLFDSIGGGDPTKVGERIFSELSGHVRDLVPFSHPHFAKALFDVGQQYAVDFASPLKRDDQIHRGQWHTWIHTDPAVPNLIVKYLSSYQADERAIGSEIERTLKAAAGKSGVSTAFIPKVVEGLLALKKSLADLGGSDPVLRDLAKKQGFEWLDDLPASALHFPVSTVDAGGKTFADFFRSFRAHADYIHRFVRNPALHPYIFCWLARLYTGPFDLGGDALNRVVNKMFSVGITKQKVRKMGLSDAERAQIKARSERILDEELKKYAGPLREDLETHLAVVQREAYESLIPRGAFTFQDLLRESERLFIKACQLAGGPVSQLHAANAALRAELSPLRQLILQQKDARIDFDQDDKEIEIPLTWEELSKILAQAWPRTLRIAKDYSVKATDLPDVEAQMKAFFTANEGLGKLSGADLKKKAVEVFEEFYLTLCMSSFRDAFTDAEAAIEAEKKTLRKLFRLRNRLEVAGQPGMTGKAVLTLPLKLESAPPKEDVDAKKKRIDRSKAKAASFREMAAAPAPAVPKASFKIALPKAGAAVPEGKGAFRKGETVVGTFTTVNTEKETFLELTPKVENPGTVSEWDFVFKDDQGVVTAPLQFDAATQKPKIEDAVEVFWGSPDASPEKDDASEQDYEKLAEIQKKLLEKFAGDPELKRTLTTLGFNEMLMATPAEQIHLGHDGMSQILGITSDMLFELSNVPAAQLQLSHGVDGAADLTDALERINLSKYYPLTDDQQLTLSAILQRYWSLTEKITDLKEYLAEVHQLGSLCETLKGSAAALVFYNETLSEHVGRVKTMQASFLYQGTASDAEGKQVEKVSPGVVYLCRSAGDPVVQEEPKPLSNPASLAVALGRLRAQVGGAPGSLFSANPENCGSPVFVSAEELPPTPFPVLFARLSKDANGLEAMLAPGTTPARRALAKSGELLLAAGLLNLPVEPALGALLPKQAWSNATVDPRILEVTGLNVRDCNATTVAGFILWLFTKKDDWRDQFTLARLLLGGRMAAGVTPLNFGKQVAALFQDASWREVLFPMGFPERARLLVYRGNTPMVDKTEGTSPFGQIALRSGSPAPAWTAAWPNLI